MKDSPRCDHYPPAHVPLPGANGRRVGLGTMYAPTASSSSPSGWISTSAGASRDEPAPIDEVGTPRRTRGNDVCVHTASCGIASGSVVTVDTSASTGPAPKRRSTVVPKAVA